MRRLLIVASVVAAAGVPVALAADPAASGIPVDVKPLKGGAVHGTVTFYAGKGGAAALVAVRELPAKSSVRILVHAGTCDRHSASFAALPLLRADARGRIDARVSVRFHHRKIPLRAISAGEHAVRVVASRSLACGELRP